MNVMRIRHLSFAVVFCLAGILFLLEFASYQQKAAALFSDHRACVSGTVISKVQQETSVCYTLRNVSFCYTDMDSRRIFHCRKAILYYRSDSIPLGSLVRSDGRIQKFTHASNEGGFDACNYYRSLQVLFRQSSDHLAILRRPGLPWKEKIFQMRCQIQKVYQNSLSSSDAGVLSAMALGDRSALEDSVKQEFQMHGLAHILAISGLHISLIGMGIFRLLRDRLKYPFSISCPFSAAFVFLFALMSGFSVSAQRAVIMYLFLMGAEYFGRTYDTGNALAFSAAIQLSVCPLSVMQAGFLMSYAAMLSIIFILPAFSRLFPDAAQIRRQHRQSAERQKKSPEHSLFPDSVPVFILMKFRHMLMQLPGIWYSGFLLSSAIWIGMMPITAFFFYQIPLYSIPLNVMLVPLCSILLSCALIGGIIGLICPLFAGLILFPCHIILSVFHFFMQLFDFLPCGNWITGRPAWSLMICFYPALFFCCILIMQNKRFRPAVSSGRFHALLRPFLRILLSLRPVIFFILPGILISVMLFLPVPETSKVDVLDVGQGDGICISSSDHRHVFVDGGSTSRDSIGTCAILPFLRYNRISGIDLWIVTHTDADHINGISEVLDSGYPVSCLLFSSAAPKDRAYQKLAACARSHHTQVSFCSEGSIIQTSDYKMTCLFPRSQEAETEKNALSQVWYLTCHGHSMLLTGDLGSRQEETLLQRNLLSETDILKVGHHGSKNSSSDSFLRHIHPDVSVISVSAHNLYGHPSEEALSRLRQCGSSVLMTKDSGQITIRFLSGEYRISCRYQNGSDLNYAHNSSPATWYSKTQTGR